MIERYALPEMAAVWSDQHRFETWWKVELAACEAWTKIGRIPKKALDQIRRKASFRIKRILEIEKKTNHDVIAFLTAIAEKIGPASRYVHLGMTSSDVVDTAQAVLLCEATDLLVKEVDRLRKILKKTAKRYARTLQIGRTHGVHAEPVTFGLKVAVWYAEMERQRQRLLWAGETIAAGKISGAVGTFAHIPPSIERYVCRKLGLKPAPAATQVLQRDRLAFYLGVLAGIGGSLEKFATEIRNLQRTEILEVEEFFAKGQKGSSAMPHKRNPLTCERVAGLSRLLRSYALAAFENQALWHERDLTHSSVERVILPDATIVLHYMLRKFSEVMEHLRVYPRRMERNLRRTGGLVVSQQVLLALVEKGLLREKAYAVVQRNALEAWEKEKDFYELLKNDPEVRKHLSAEELRALFDLSKHQKFISFLLKRTGVL